jgi:hypothetical protein
MRQAKFVQRLVRMNFHAKTWLLLCSGMMLLGCSQAAEVTVDPAPAEAVAALPAAASGAVEAQPTSAGARSPDLAVNEKASKQVAAFTPPFPERLELFEPPQRAQSTIRHGDENGATVELKGFIFVDEPRVVLSIDGVVSSIPAGGEKYGVQVISIEPPTVVLQRGRTRWPATLE